VTLASDVRACGKYIHIEMPMSTPPGQSDLLPDSISRRRTMVDCQIRTFDVTDQRVLVRFLEVPREIFLPEKSKDLAYSDAVVEVNSDPADGQPRQLLPPLVLARLLQSAAIKPDDKILDIAPGTGYSTALLAGLGADVTALEADPGFASRIAANLRACDVRHVDLVTGPLAQGVSKHAPYDLIFINGAVEAELETLFGQLKQGGRLVAIQRFAGAANAHASKAVRFDKGLRDVSSRYLFDASAALLKEFQKAPQFVF
jgi:protein-L-isoaspartate(D-aspartate) O-methyltransferase